MDQAPENTSAVDVLEGVARYHLTEPRNPDEARMDADPTGKWVWFEEAMDFTPASVSLARHTLYSPSDLDVAGFDHAGNRRALMIRCEDGIWVEEKALRELVEQQRAATEAPQPPTWAEVRVAMESLLRCVDQLTTRESDLPLSAAIAPYQARALLARLPTEE